MAEILSEVLKSGVSSQKVVKEYERLVNIFHSELEILRRTEPEAISQVAGNQLAQAISKVRQGDIVVSPGFDGVFGRVKIWPSEEKQPSPPRQTSLF